MEYIHISIVQGTINNVRLEHKGLKKTCQGAHNLPPKQQEIGSESKVPEDLSLAQPLKAQPRGAP